MVKIYRVLAPSQVVVWDFFYWLVNRDPYSELMKESLISLGRMSSPKKPANHQGPLVTAHIMLRTQTCTKKCHHSGKGLAD